MPTTQEELAAKRERVEKLREQLSAAEAQRVSRESDAQAEIESAHLDAEAARLQAQLDVAKNASKVGVVKAGNAGLMETIKQDHARADAFAKAQEAARAASQGSSAAEPANDGSADGKTTENTKG